MSRHARLLVLLVALPSPSQDSRLLDEPLVAVPHSDVEGLAPSPDDTRVAFRLSGRGHWLAIAPADGSGPARVVAGGGDLVVSTWAWAGDEHLVLVAGRAGPAHLYSVAADGGSAPVRLDPPGAAYEAWQQVTAGGERVVFRARSRRDAVDLYGAPADGSSPAVHLGPATGPARDLGAAELTSDGERVVFLAGPGAEALRLHSARVDGADPAVVLDPGGAGVHELALEPRGARVAFTTGERGRPAFLLAAPVDGRAPARRLAGPVRGGIAGLLVAGTDVVFRADEDEDGRFELHRVPLDGSSTARRLSARETDVSHVHAVTPDGRRVLYEVACGANAGLYAVAVDGRAAAMRLHDAGVGALAVTEDSTTAVFEAGPAGRRSLHARRLDGSGAVAALSGTQTPGGVGAFDLVPRSRAVVFDSGGELFRAALDPPEGSAGPLRLLPERTPGSAVRDLRASHDGARVFFSVERTAGRRELFACPLSGAEAPLHLDGTFVSGTIAATVEAAGEITPRQ